VAASRRRLIPGAFNAKASFRLPQLWEKKKNVPASQGSTKEEVREKGGEVCVRRRGRELGPRSAEHLDDESDKHARFIQKRNGSNEK